MTSKVKVLIVFLAIFLATGCSKVVVRSDADPSADFRNIQTLYVKKLPADEREINKVLQDKLIEFGFDATTGSEAKPAGSVDAIVTYEDRWMWDMTMYMLSIDIHFLNPETEYEFASGSSYRTSLVRKPPEEMVDEALRDLLTGKIDLPPRKEVKEEEPEEDN